MGDDYLVVAKDLGLAALAETATGERFDRLTRTLIGDVLADPERFAQDVAGGVKVAVAVKMTVTLQPDGRLDIDAQVTGTPAKEKADGLSGKLKGSTARLYIDKAEAVTLPFSKKEGV